MWPGGQAWPCWPVGRQLDVALVGPALRRLRWAAGGWRADEERPARVTKACTEHGAHARLAIHRHIVGVARSTPASFTAAVKQPRHRPGDGRPAQRIASGRAALVAGGAEPTSGMPPAPARPTLAPHRTPCRPAPPAKRRNTTGETQGGRVRPAGILRNRRGIRVSARSRRLSSSRGVNTDPCGVRG